MVEVENISLTRNRIPIIKNLSLSVPRGVIVAIVGKSGIGKTTLLRCIAQLEPSYIGTIKINGRNLRHVSAPERAQLVGLVQQHYNLFPHMTILENCIQPLMLIKKYHPERAEAEAMTLLKRCSMSAIAHRYPHRLSGGQQQRAALIRSAVMRPSLLMLDEPTSALDKENALIVQDILTQLATEGTSVIFTTHNTLFATSAAHKIYELGGKETGTLSLMEEGRH